MLPMLPVLLVLLFVLLQFIDSITRLGMPLVKSLVQRLNETGCANAIFPARTPATAAALKQRNSLGRLA